MIAAQPNFYETTSLYTYRNLPAWIRRKLTTKEVKRVLKVRDNYLSGLTYTQKVLMSDEQLALVVQKRLKKSRFSTSRQMLQRVFRAEAIYYRELAEQQAFVW